MEKIKALGPLQLTVKLEDYVKDFCDSLETDSLPSEASSTPVVSYLEICCRSIEKDLVSREDAVTLTNLDSGDLLPLDCHVWDPSSSEDSVCDWSSDDLSSSECCDLLKDLSSDDPSSLCDLLKDMPPTNWSQWLDDLMEDLSDLSSDDVSSLYDVLKDMSPDDWVQEMSFDLDDFVS